MPNCGDSQTARTFVLGIITYPHPIGNEVAEPASPDAADTVTDLRLSI